MNSTIFNEAMSELNSKYINEALNYKKRPGKAVWIIAAAAAAACFCVFIIAAVFEAGGLPENSGNRPNTAIANDFEGEFVELEVKSGTYYLNGDKNAKLWFEATPDYLILKGTDVDKAIMDVVTEYYEGNSYPYTDEDINRQFEEDKMLYCGEKIYVVQYVGFENYPYWLLVSRDNSEKDRSELKEKTSGAAAWLYNDKTNTIKTGMFGDFILVE